MKRYLFLFWILFVSNHLFGQNYDSSGIYTGPTLSAPFVVDFSSTTSWVQPLPTGGLTSSLTQSADVAFVNCILQNRTPSGGTTSQVLRTNGTASIIYLPKFSKVNQLIFEGFVVGTQAFTIQRWDGTAWQDVATKNFPSPTWGSLEVNIGIDTPVQLRYTQTSGAFMAIKKITVSDSPVLISGQTFTSQQIIGNLFNVTIENCTFKNMVASPALGVTDCKNVIIKNCLIENIKYSSSQGIALRINNFSDVLIDSITIRHHRAPNGHSSALNIDGALSKNITVQNSTIYDVDGGGIVTNGTSTVDVEPGKSTHDRPIPGVKILNNLIYDTGLSPDDSPLQNSPKHGMYVKAWDCLVEGNTVYNAWDGQCISIRSTGVVRGNTCYNARTGPFSYWPQKPAGPSNKLIVENNVFYQTKNMKSVADTRPISTDVRLLAINPWDTTVGKKFDDFIVRFNTVVMYNAVQTNATIPVIFIGFNYNNVKVYGNYIVDLRTVANTPKYLSNYVTVNSVTALAKNTSNYTASNFNGFVDGANFDFRLAGSSGAINYANTEIDFPTNDIENNKRVGGSLDAGAYNIAKWTGATNTNWSISTNWQNGSIPKSGAAIYIPTAAINYPLLDINRTVGDLNLQSGAKLGINEKTLTINGAMNGLGAITGSSTSNLLVGGGGALGTIYFDQTNAGVSNVLNKLTINRTNSGSLSLGNALQITGVLTPTAGTFNTNGFLTLKSTSIANSAIVGKATGAVLGNVTVERFIPNGFRAYRDIGAGVFKAGSVFSNWQEGGSYTNTGYGIFITGGTPFPSGTVNSADNTTGFDRSINAVKSAYYYKSGTWSALTNTTSEQINPYLGYRFLIRGDRGFNIFTTPINPISNGIYPMVSSTTLRTIGKLITGTVTFSTAGIQNSISGTTYQSSAFGLNATSNGFSSVANPYVCPIDWKQVYENGQLTNIQPNYYYLDPSFGSVGAYFSYNPVSDVSNFPAMYRRFVQAGQAFFVQTASAGSPQLVIKETDKSDTATKTAVFGASPNYSKLYINLLKKNGTDYKLMDAAVAVFSITFSNGIGKEDALKIDNSFDNLSINNLSIINGSNQFSIDGRKPVASGDSIFLRIDQLSDMVGYRLQIDAKAFTNVGFSLFLVDKYLNTLNPIRDSTTNFDINVDTTIKASYQNRFAVVFKPIALPIAGITLQAKLTNQLVKLRWKDETGSTIIFYDIEKSMDGIVFEKIGTLKASTLVNQDIEFVDNDLLDDKSYYRIKAVNVVGDFTYSNLIFMQHENKERTPNIFINSANSNNNTLQLCFKEVKKGSYFVSIHSIDGKRFFEQIIKHEGETRNYALQLNGVGIHVFLIEVLSKENGNRLFSSPFKLAH